MTVSLPASVAKEFEAVRRAERRSPAGLVREALRVYLRVSPALTPTKAQRVAMQRGRLEVARGQYLTLSELSDALAAANRTKRTKGTRKSSR